LINLLNAILKGIERPQGEEMKVTDSLSQISRDQGYVRSRQGLRSQDRGDQVDEQKDFEEVNSVEGPLVAKSIVLGFPTDLREPGTRK